MDQAPNTNRKSGIRKRRAREARRRSRDEKIFGLLRYFKNASESRHALIQEPIEPLSVYTGKEDHRWGPELTVFPVLRQGNGQPMPKWADLSAWLKIQVSALALQNWSFQTFNVQIHPKLEQEWVSQAKDVRTMMRDRLRRELDRAVRTQVEWFFVIEGMSTRTRAQTNLHIHGGASTIEPGDAAKVMTAVSRAAGHGLTGYPKVPRAVHGKKFRVERAAYATYLLKFARRHDDRLQERRLTMSRSMVGAARAFWETITGQWQGTDTDDDADYVAP